MVNSTRDTDAIEAAQAIGPVDIDYGDDNSCEPLDVLKHLTSDYVVKKFAAANQPRIVNRIDDSPRPRPKGHQRFGRDFVG